MQTDPAARNLSRGVSLWDLEGRHGRSRNHGKTGGGHSIHMAYIDGLSVKKKQKSMEFLMTLFLWRTF